MIPLKPRESESCGLESPPDCCIASGAFPLAPDPLARSSAKAATRTPKGSAGSPHSGQSGRVTHTHFLYVDGGVVDNEPMGLGSGHSPSGTQTLSIRTGTGPIHALILVDAFSECPRNC